MYLWIKRKTFKLKIKRKNTNSYITKKKFFFLFLSGRLIPEKLEEMIKESKNANERPFLVILTEGTTVLGILILKQKFSPHKMILKF